MDSVEAMQSSLSGRVAFIAQWIVPVVFTFFLFWGRAFVGAELGWLSVVGILFAIVMVVLLYIAPVLTIFDRDVRPTGTARSSYAMVSLLLWIALFVMAISVPDQADGPPLPTALTVWTHGGISVEMSSFIFTLAFVFGAIMWVATITLAIMGIVRSRRPQGTAVPRPGAFAAS